MNGEGLRLDDEGDVTMGELVAAVDEPARATSAGVSAGTKMTAAEARTDRGDGAVALERSLSLPLLVFYGLGVTVGAGIFALIGEILKVSGNQAPLAFLTAGVIAGVTGLSYMQLVREFPRAGGEAIYVTHGLGRRFGRIAGLGVVATGTISSAVVALAFGGYVRSLFNTPTIVGALLIVALVGIVAIFGVRESVTVAAVVTAIEIGTLIVVAIYGLPRLADGSSITTMFTAEADGFASPILAGAVLAFFAFIGFEDIANMAEETVDPQRAAPRAIAWTLGISIAIYVVLASIAVLLPNRQEIASADAPMTALYEGVGGRGSDLVSTVASLAMTNGILAQVMMSARMLFGMASERLLPAPLQPLGVVNRRRKTPVRATLLVCGIVAILVLLVPLGRLARVTSLFTLVVFTLVNLALYMLARRPDSRMHAWRFVGLFGALLTTALALWELFNLG